MIILRLKSVRDIRSALFGLMWCLSDREVCANAGSTVAEACGTDIVYCAVITNEGATGLNPIHIQVMARHSCQKIPEVNCKYLSFIFSKNSKIFK